MPHPPALEGSVTNPNPTPINRGGGQSGTGVTPLSYNLLTSTGGLQGFSGILLLPIVDLKSGKFLMATFDIDNFDTEVSCNYNFRQEDLAIGRKVTIRKVIIVYRDLGQAKFQLDLEAYIRDNDTFVHNKRGPVTVKIGTKKADRKLRTKFVDVMITGERPQLLNSRVRDSGPLSFVSFTLVGDLAEGDQL